MEKFILSNQELKYLGYFMEKENHIYAQKTDTIREIYYLDCEMVETLKGYEVILLGLGNVEQSHIIRVKPTSQVINYLTEITGCDESTEFDMTFDELSNYLKHKLAPNDILIGHHMYHDLQALNFYHNNIIDTCMIFHHPDGPPHYYSLKTLAKMHLHIQIQQKIHNPLEDGLTCYRLLELCIDSKFIKTKWDCIGEIFTPNPNLIISAVDQPKEYIYCIYTRGSRAVGTNKPESDYDFVVICDIKCHILNGTLIKFGNFDICIYDAQYFQNMLQTQVIWALECIYCPTELCLLEKINYKKMIEEYRQTHKNLCNDNLKKSIGMESSRKISSAKRHFENKNHHHAKKHIFIAMRFVDYGRQLIKYGKIENIRNINSIWFEILEKIPNDCADLDTYKSYWKDIYINMNREFSSHVPKIQKVADNDLAVYKNMIFSNVISSEMGSVNSGNAIDSNTLNNLIELLKKPDGEDILRSQYMIFAYPSSNNPNIVLLRYSNRTPQSQFKQICRGIIFDKTDNRWTPIAYPFNNFVTVEEDKIDPSNILHIFDKIDGSFACLYYHNGVWSVSSSKHPHGDALLGIRKQHNIVFDQLFWSIFNAKYKLHDLNKRYCYMFEMISPDNPIVIQYDTNNLILTGARNMDTFEELDIVDHEFRNFERPIIYNDFQIDKLDPNICEGYVIVLKDFSRIKIKTAEYIKKSFLFPLCTNRKNNNMNFHMLKVVQEQQESEFYRHCPEYADTIKTIKQLYDDFIKNILQLHKEAIENANNRRDYALYINKFNNNYRKYLFGQLDKKNIELFVASMHTKKLYKDLFQTVDKKEERIKHIYQPIPQSEWANYQIVNSSKVIKTDMMDVSDIRYVGGLDISFSKTDDSKGCAYVTIYDLSNNKIVYEDHKLCSLNVPYVSGFLGFREIPEYVFLLNKLKVTEPALYPHVLMIDGSGIMHHRQFGSASHIGCDLNMPSIGIAKTLLCMDGMDEKTIKERFRAECKNKGDYIELKGNSGTVYGAALKSANSADNPIYVSIGHGISLHSAISITHKCCLYKNPEPIRNSDIKSKLYL